MRKNPPKLSIVLALFAKEKMLFNLHYDCNKFTADNVAFKFVHRHANVALYRLFKETMEELKVMENAK